MTTDHAVPQVGQKRELPHGRTFFDFGRRNRLSLGVIVSDDDFDQMTHWCLSGRIFGKHINVLIPWRVHA